MAIMRGPRSPGPVVSYGMKCYYAQQAGAAAVVFVDWDPNGYIALSPKSKAASNPKPRTLNLFLHLCLSDISNFHDTILPASVLEPQILNLNSDSQCLHLYTANRRGGDLRGRSKTRLPDPVLLHIEQEHGAPSGGGHAPASFRARQEPDCTFWVEDWLHHVPQVRALVCDRGFGSWVEDWLHHVPQVRALVCGQGFGSWVEDWLHHVPQVRALGNVA